MQYTADCADIFYDVGQAIPASIDLSPYNKASNALQMSAVSQVQSQLATQGVLNAMQVSAVLVKCCMQRT